MHSEAKCAVSATVVVAYRCAEKGVQPNVVNRAVKCRTSSKIGSAASSKAGAGASKWALAIVQAAKRRRIVVGAARDVAPHARPGAANNPRVTAQAGVHSVGATCSLCAQYKLAPGPLASGPGASAFRRVNPCFTAEVRCGTSSHPWKGWMAEDPTDRLGA